MILFWPSVPLSQRDRLPSKPGLYAVRWLFITWYVGKSVNLRNRWDDHHRYPQAKRLPWCRIAYCTMHKDAIHEAERRLIRLNKRPYTWNDTRVPSKLELWRGDVIRVILSWCCLMGLCCWLLSYWEARIVSSLILEHPTESLTK